MLIIRIQTEFNEKKNFLPKQGFVFVSNRNYKNSFDSMLFFIWDFNSSWIHLKRDRFLLRISLKRLQHEKSTDFIHDAVNCMDFGFNFWNGLYDYRYLSDGWIDQANVKLVRIVTCSVIYFCNLILQVPNEIGSLEPLRGYQGEDIEIQLPGNLTVYDIDWLAVWCVKYRHNFGHVYIPKDLDVPPALGQTKIAVNIKFRFSSFRLKSDNSIKWT